MADNTQKRKFLFNVDIMIEEETNGRALEVLLHLLNTTTVTDYQIKQGIELGKQIAAERSKGAQPFEIKASAAKAALKEKPAPTAVSSERKPAAVQEKDEFGDPDSTLWREFRKLQQSGALLRLSVVRGMGVKLNMPCRILNTEPENGNLTVYHVDEKQVYLFKINEIENFEVS